MPTATPKKPRRRPKPAAEATAVVETCGRTQSVKLPRQFHLDAKKVRIRRDGPLLVLEPLDAGPVFDREAWVAKLERYRHIPFMPGGRQQPPMPERDPSLDWD